MKDALKDRCLNEFLTTINYGIEKEKSLLDKKNKHLKKMYKKEEYSLEKSIPAIKWESEAQIELSNIIRKYKKETMINEASWLTGQYLFYYGLETKNILEEPLKTRLKDAVLGMVYDFINCIFKEEDK